MNSKNKKSYLIQYKASTASSYSNLTSGTASSYSISIATGALGGSFAATTSYEIKLTITDNFTSVSRTMTVPTTSLLLNWRSTGKGLAIGKASEKDGFEVALPSYFTSTATFSGTTTIGGKNVGTYLSQVDTNKSNISSVTSRVTKIEQNIQAFSISVSISKANTWETQVVKFPKAFSKAPVVIVQAQTGQSGTLVWADGATTTQFTLHKYRPSTTAFGAQVIAVAM